MTLIYISNFLYIFLIRKLFVTQERTHIYNDSPYNIIKLIFKRGEMKR